LVQRAIFNIGYGHVEGRRDRVVGRGYVIVEVRKNVPGCKI
jgi:hypothetical protein